MPRQARLDTPGTLHHVIIRGIEKRSLVEYDTDRDDFVFRLGKIAGDTQTAIYAWALMPNHAHILLRSGPHGLPKFMRRLLTGYAVAFNLRHKRNGHLFQNRYKSIVCEEEPYFRELVRYIHLNPIRANLLKNMRELDRYAWCGHTVLIGKTKYEWQDQDYVLRFFGNTDRAAIKNYRQYARHGISQGPRPDLVGGGLIRSKGGWSQVLAARRQGERDHYDERILGGSDFVKQVINEASRQVREQFPDVKAKENMHKAIHRICDQSKIELMELKKGSRRPEVSKARLQIAQKLVKEYGLSLAEVARQIGVTPPAVYKMVHKGEA